MRREVSVGGPGGGRGGLEEVAGDLESLVALVGAWLREIVRTDQEPPGVGGDGLVGVVDEGDEVLGIVAGGLELRQVWGGISDAIEGLVALAGNDLDRLSGHGQLDLDEVEAGLVGEPAGGLRVLAELSAEALRAADQLPRRW